MKKRKTQYLCFLMFITSLCACDKETSELETPTASNGMSHINISFSLPQTYAADMDHATPEETAL